MRNISRLAAVFMALALFGPAHAGPFEDASAAYKRGDYAGAIRIIRPLAEKGDLRAQFNLGTIYYNGQGVRRDYAEAAKWFRMAAEQRDAEAQRYLGFMHANGFGVAKDDREAFRWYSLAAERGDPDAEVNLGVMYSSGRGVEQNRVQAHKWFSVAAKRYPASEKEKRETAEKNIKALTAKMSPAEVAEGERLARAWTPKT